MKCGSRIIEWVGRTKARCFIGIVGLVFVLPLIWGCAVTPDTPMHSAPSSDINSLLVLPFKIYSGVQRGEPSVRCPLCGAIFDRGDVRPDAPNTMTRHLLDFLRASAEYQLILPGQIEESVRSQLLLQDIKGQELSILIEIGRTVGADAIVTGYIYRYQERIGTAYSVDTPASVAFGLHLIRVADGHFIWRGNFDETQASLSEDCLKIFSFIQRGGKWLTADELAGAGLAEVLETFPVK